MLVEFTSVCSARVDTVPAYSWTSLRKDVHTNSRRDTDLALNVFEKFLHGYLELCLSSLISLCSWVPSEENLVSEASHNTFRLCSEQLPTCILCVDKGGEGKHSLGFIDAVVLMICRPAALVLDPAGNFLMFGCGLVLDERELAVALAR